MPRFKELIEEYMGGGTKLAEEVHVGGCRLGSAGLGAL
jgi:hypothetical protein